MNMLSDIEVRIDDLKFLRGLVDLLADPAAVKQRIDDLAEAAAGHEAASVSAAREVKALKEEREQHAGALAQQLSDHRHQLREEREELNAEINRRRAEVAAAEKAVAAAKTAAESDARQAVELRARWQKKIDAVDAGLRA
jgi:predicted  nucleic acid-binding Zn-ribbon protein